MPTYQSTCWFFFFRQKPPSGLWTWSLQYCLAWLLNHQSQATKIVPLSNPNRFLEKICLLCTQFSLSFLVLTQVSLFNSSIVNCSVCESVTIPRQNTCCYFSAGAGGGEDKEKWGISGIRAEEATEETGSASLGRQHLRYPVFGTTRMRQHVPLIIWDD